MQVIWLEQARMSLATIIRDVASEDPSAARKLMARLAPDVLQVLYRQGRVRDTRESVALAGYVLVYQLTFGRIEVVSILRTQPRLGCTLPEVR
jgi:plasmid stabilization system protein ParE